MDTKQIIKDLIKEVNLFTKNTRKKLRELLILIEDNGGYIALEYTRAVDFYKQEFDYNFQYISSESTAKDIEQLLKIPVGTYQQKNLPIEQKKLIYCRTDRITKSGLSYWSIACSLQVADKIKEEWAGICKKISSTQPTESEISKLCDKGSIDSFRKIKESRDKIIKILSEENQRLREENQQLKEQKINGNIPRATRIYISQLREENDKLKDKNAKLERELREYYIRKVS